MTIKLFPSQLTWTENGANAAATNSHCWRFIKLTRNLPKQPFPTIYAEIGALHEDLHAAELGNSAQREVPWQFHTDDYYLSGRCDFLLADSVDECKSTLKPLYLKDLPKEDHLFQLCMYLGYFQKQRGRLIYGRIQRDKATGNLVRTAVETVDVTVEDSGAVKVGLVDTGHNMDRILEPAAGLAAAIASDEIPYRPIARGWGGPCKYCPLSGACNNFDHGELSAEELKAAVPEILAATPQKEPHVTSVKLFNPKGK